MSNNPHPESASSGRPMRPQYHFFYGSTDSSSNNNNNNNDDSQSRSSMADHRSSSVTNEQESLLGESLVPTDNEEEPPNSTDFDLQHVLISNGNNGGMRHVVGGGITTRNGTGSKNGKSANNSHHSQKGKNGSNGSNGDHVHNIQDSFRDLRESHPVVHIVGLVGCMTLCMVIFAVTLFPTSTRKTADSLGIHPVEATRKFIMTFPTVDRSKSNDPVKLFLQADLFHPDLRYDGKDPFRIFKFPFPTGAFWTNLVLPATADHGFSYPIVVYPYAYKWSETSLQASYPANHRKEETKAIHDYFIPDLTFGVTEQVQQRYITNFDPLSVTLQFQTSSTTTTTTTSSSSNNKGGGGAGSWQTFLVQGSPYTTLEYDNVTPRIQALSTFKNVVCPGEENYKDDDFDDNFSDDDGNNSRRTRRRRRLLGVCGVSVRSCSFCVVIVDCGGLMSVEYNHCIIIEGSFYCRYGITQ